MSELTRRSDVWHTGSFTKNFRWGRSEPPGLKRLYDAINVGFSGELIATPRDLFRERLKKDGFLDYIPANFFLYNRIIDKEAFVIVDELVFRSLTGEHNSDYDKLALYSLLLSQVGAWPGARRHQRNPAEWARNYVLRRFSRSLRWDISRATADDIQRFLISSKEFAGEDTRKLATNLSFIFQKAHLGDFSIEPPGRWWADAIFLSLDRNFLDSVAELSIPNANRFTKDSQALELAGGASDVRVALARQVIRLYVASHGLERFAQSETSTFFHNNNEPLVAVISGEQRVEKRLPRVVWEWLEERLFVELKEQAEVAPPLTREEALSRVGHAVASLRSRGLAPSLSGDDLLHLRRG